MSASLRPLGIKLGDGLGDFMKFTTDAPGDDPAAGGAVKASSIGRVPPDVGRHGRSTRHALLRGPFDRYSLTQLSVGGLDGRPCAGGLAQIASCAASGDAGGLGVASSSSCRTSKSTGLTRW